MSGFAVRSKGEDLVIYLAELLGEEWAAW